jgi:hypothetical protein
MLYVLAVRVSGSAIGGFFAHAFLADEVADSIGWPTGSPFQLEVAFANLALGILAVLAMNRRDGFRDATVIAVTVFAGGATITHFTDIGRDGQPRRGQHRPERGQRPPARRLDLAASRHPALRLPRGTCRRTRAPVPVAGHRGDRGRSDDCRGIGDLQPRLRPGSARDRGRRRQPTRRGHHSTRRPARSSAPRLIGSAHLDARRDTRVDCQRRCWPRPRPPARAVRVVNSRGSASDDRPAVRSVGRGTAGMRG